jgi:hypothetical protein
MDDGRGGRALQLCLVGLLAGVTAYGFVTYSGVLAPDKPARPAPVAAKAEAAKADAAKVETAKPETTGSTAVDSAVALPAVVPVPRPVKRVDPSIRGPR